VAVHASRGRRRHAAAAEKSLEADHGVEAAAEQAVLEVDLARSRGVLLAPFHLTLDLHDAAELAKGRNQAITTPGFVERELTLALCTHLGWSHLRVAAATAH